MGRLLALVAIMAAVMATVLVWGAAPAAAQDKAAWDKLVAAAQQEGTVVVKGPPHAELRKCTCIGDRIRQARRRQRRKPTNWPVT